MQSTAITLEFKLNVYLRLVKPHFMQSTAFNLEFKVKVIFKLLSCNRPIKYRTSDGGRTFSTIGYTCKLVRTAIRRVARRRPGSLDLNYMGFI